MFPIGSTTIGSEPSITPVGGLVRVAKLGLAGQRRLAVDLHPAGAADRRPAGAAHGEAAVFAVLGLEDAVEHRQRLLEVDLEFLPVRAATRFGLVSADLERVLGHQ